MVSPQKRNLLFLFAVLVLCASPALAVPLSSGIDNPGVAAYGTGYTDPDGETTLPVDGTAQARIVDSKEVAMTEAGSHAASHSAVGMSGQASADMGHATPGWIVPAAAVGAGGGALFAVLSHDKGGDASLGAGSALDSPADLGASGSGGGITAMGTTNDGTPGGNDVPEPGTIMLMGAGIASFLGRRKILSR